jgi:phage tail-like protein
VLQRGRTHAEEFERWANLVSPLNGAIALKGYRKDIAIDFFNEAGQLVLSFKLYRCWPSAYAMVGPLEAKNTSIAIESLTLQREAWERDQAVVEPKEP